MRPQTFTFRGRELEYFEHPYNAAGTNERTVEVPIILDRINAGRGRILEVGNVLGHYVDRDWDVVDRYEEGAGIVREDILAYRPEMKYDLIVSISTLEHVRWDEQPRENDGAARAVAHLRTLLDGDGRMVFTLPIGYNPHVDCTLKAGCLGMAWYLLRVSADNEWRQCGEEEALANVYGYPYNCANAMAVCEVVGNA